MPARRLAPYLIAVLAAAGLVAGTTSAASAPDRPSYGKRGVVGHLAFVSKNNHVYTVAVKGSGNTVGQTRIGPLSEPPAGKKLAVGSLEASSDGEFVAWQEQPVKNNGEPASATPTLVLHDVTTFQSWTLQTDAAPIGFGSADQLVVSDGSASVLDLQPSPHLTPVLGGQDPAAVYPDGVVELTSLSSPPGPKVTVRVQLSSFEGVQTTVHNYVVKPSNPRIPETAFVSPDGDRLLVERGDHTDFGGVGPSSLVDEFTLTGPPKRKELGHFGTAKAAWRVGAASFAWTDDEPWVVFERATKHGAQTAVAVHQHHTWRKIVPYGIAVAADADGFVVAQPGMYKFDADGVGFTKVPSGDALVQFDTLTKVLGIGGSAFVWVARPGPPPAT